MTTYRPGNHHGVTIVREGDGARCGRPDHDCERGHLAVLVVDGGEVPAEDLAERICALLNGDEPSEPAEDFSLLDGPEQRAAHAEFLARIADKRRNRGVTAGPDTSDPQPDMYEQIRAAVEAAEDARDHADDLIRHACPERHWLVQHRDGRKPWCNACGYDTAGRRVREVGTAQQGTVGDEPGAAE